VCAALHAGATIAPGGRLPQHYRPRNRST